MRSQQALLKTGSAIWSGQVPQLHWAPAPLLVYPSGRKISPSILFQCISTTSQPPAIHRYQHSDSAFLKKPSQFLDPAPQKAPLSRLSKSSLSGLLSRSASTLDHLYVPLLKMLLFICIFLGVRENGDKTWKQCLNAFNKAQNTRCE